MSLVTVLQLLWIVHILRSTEDMILMNVMNID